MIEITSLRHAFPEQSIYIDRKYGHPNYTFLHFFHSVSLFYNGQMIRTQPHSVIIFQPQTFQHFENSTPIVHDWIHFKGDVHELLEKTCLKPDQLYCPCQTDFITEITREMETEFYSSRMNRNDLIGLKFEELFLKLGRAITGDNTPQFNGKTIDKFRYLRGEMFSRLNEKWPVERMAQEVGYSKSRFYSIYREIYGTSPTADLIEARTNSARNMLISSKESIENLSFKLGYESASHFIRQFKSQTGYSPTAYRKKISADPEKSNRI